MLTCDIRWVYILEGIFSTLVAVWIYFGLPNEPENAYFLTDEQKWMMRVRQAQRANYMGSDKFSWEEVRLAATDPKLYMRYIPPYQHTFYLYRRREREKNTNLFGDRHANFADKKVE
jgi:hypothetical protein